VAAGPFIRARRVNFLSALIRYESFTLTLTTALTQTPLPVPVVTPTVL